MILNGQHTVDQIKQLRYFWLQKWFKYQMENIYLVFSLMLLE